ncbi:unnamed protein product [Ceratitis capitata]|uniref:(Mediterranean fruit fly) hypothetical protein n=1 Tax=Ceratitis capitata TaxID=7213 RepID=A0A811UMS8_CERCA|nr:unnamed protein product [Ceratitis capitata]
MNSSAIKVSVAGVVCFLALCCRVQIGVGLEFCNTSLEGGLWQQKPKQQQQQQQHIFDAL